MAVKKKLLDYTYEDLFDTQEALDTGILNQVNVGTYTTTTSGSKGFLGFGKGRPKTSEPMDLMANKDNLGSLLGLSDAIAANKKRKQEQLKVSSQAGLTGQQSILGGGAF